MTPLDPKTEGASADLIAQNIAKLKVLFPELVTETGDGVAINEDVLKQLVGERVVTEASEKYGLSWHGKGMARQLALTPSMGTLRPCPEDSVDWETTQNLMIEGDNLEVLKLLQKSYAGKVKLIYIDPPYNTGKDFVYKDNFQNGIRNYLELTGQVEGGARISSNTEASGRFHTDWLNMMYPRLKIAHNLLSKEGVICISIDTNEQSRLDNLCADIFGEENHVATITWQKKRGKDNSAKHISVSHEYIVMYARSINDLKLNRFPMSEKRKRAYSNPDGDRRGMYVLQPAWASGMKRGPSYSVSLGGDVFSERMWLYSKKNLLRMYEEGRLSIKGKHKDGNPNVYLKVYLSESSGVLSDTIWTDAGNTGDAVGEVKSVFDGECPFVAPKPIQLMSRLIELCTDPGDTVLDFFAGSGSTGVATQLLNGMKGSASRRFALVQLPEQLNTGEISQQVGAKICMGKNRPANIAELTKMRIGTATKPRDKWDPLCDLGFRVFKLDSSNLEAWDPDRANLEGSLDLHENRIKPDRTEQDLLYEILLKLGLDLCTPMESRQVDDLTLNVVGGGSLFACLTDRIAGTQVEGLAQGIIQWRDELDPAGEVTCIFRDDAFADDVAKTNLTEILKQAGISQVRSL